MLRFLFSALFSLMTWLSVSLSASADPGQTPIVLGAIYNITGVHSVLDMPSALGAQLAVRQLNQQGGILGQRVKLELVDGQSRPSVIREQAKRFALDPAVSVVIGLNDTNMVLAAAPELAQAHKLFITSGATSPKLPAQVPGYLFLAAYTDNLQASAMAEYALTKLNAKKAYVLADENMSYTILLADYFQQAYKKLGGRIIGVHTFKQNAPLTSQIALLKSTENKPDVIFLAAGPREGGALIEALRQAGIKQPILGGDSFDDRALIKNLNDEADNIYFTSHAFIDVNNPDKSVIQFIEKFQSYYRQTPGSSFAALGYDSVNLLAAAITKAQSTDPEKIRLALYTLKNWPGVTGYYSYNNMAVPEKPVAVIKIQDGKEMLAKQ